MGFTLRCACLGIWAAVTLAYAAEKPAIFPEPQQIRFREASLRLDDAVVVAVPASASAADLSLARAFAAEAGDRFGVALRVERHASLPAGRFILLGTAKNPLVHEYLSARRLPDPPAKAEGYSLRVDAGSAVVVGNDESGAFYGMQSLRQLLTREGGAAAIRGVEVEDWPHMAFRGIRMYLPGHENLAFFRRFVHDFMALYKFNRLILEVNASMRLDRHPEVNAGWIDFARDLYFTQRYFPLGPRGTEQNSAHHDTADGEILEKDEVVELAREVQAQHIEIVPEIPTFTHAYYLLTRHKNLGAITGAEWPDVYDPSNPDTYKLVFDVLDEYIDVFHPKLINIGHDEMFFPVELCPACQKRDATQLYADDVRRIRDHLKSKGIRTAMYGDHLVESVRGAGRQKAKSTTGWEYTMPGALSPEQVRALVPKDVLVLNWFWQDARADVGRGEPNDVKLSEFGFQQIYANFYSGIENFGRRSARPGVLGGAPSSWSATNEYTIGKDLMMDFLGTANLMWSTHWPDEERLSKIVQGMMPDIRRRLGGRLSPSETGDPVRPAPFSGSGSTTGLPAIVAGRLESGRMQFEVRTPAVVGVEGASKSRRPAESAAIPIGADASSLIFLHATAAPAGNDMSWHYIHNFPDTADLLGWYDVVYEDGFVDTVPIRYGWNILPLGWGAQSDVIAKGSAKMRSYAYAADAVAAGDATLFAYEWTNPRFGKVIRELRLHGTSGFVDVKGKRTPENAIVLAAVSFVPKRPAPPMKAAK